MLQLTRWKIYGILTVVLAALIYLLPNVLPPASLAKLPAGLAAQHINLGLDLRGGSYVLLKVDDAALSNEKLQGLQDEIGEKFKDANIAADTPVRAGDTVTVHVNDPSKLDQARKILRALAGNTGTAALGGKTAEFDLAEDNGTFKFTFTDELKKAAERDGVQSSIPIFRQRLDAMGTAEPLLQTQGDDRIIVQLPGVADPQDVVKTLTQTAKMTFHLVDDEHLIAALGGRVPPGEQILYGEGHNGQQEPTLIKRRAALGGEKLKDARASVDQRSGEMAVSFTFDTDGARKFGDITRRYLGKRFAIVLDGKIISAPVIRSPILTGDGQITGSFTAEEANKLAVLLKAGALPLSFTIADQRTVGAELGADSIHAGIIATVIGSLAVIAFIFLAYGLFGLFANIAVIVNALLILAVLQLFHATLTLPGIAGIVLTVGMAVDSNVLIYERMKEELKAGKTPINALDAGFSRALATILDANLTTALAAAILFQLGAGPVRGFAVTHLIGTLTTIFTAFTMTRLMIAIWVRATRPKRLPIDPRPGPDGKRPWFRLIPDNLKIPFMRYRLVADAISISGVLASIAFFVLLGLNYSIDFKGGVLIELSTQGPADLGKIRHTADNLGLQGHPQVVEFGAPNDVLIRMETQPGGDEAQPLALKKMEAGLKSALGETAHVVRTEVVGPTVGHELVRDGIIALLVAVALMLVYVWFRFEWQFGVGAVVGLFHDIIVTIGVFALFHLEFSLTTIAALLTIIGYSMNDKVVISDRIRENLRKHKKIDLGELIDRSLNETLSRTLMTAITTLLALGSLYIFGGQVIRVFTFAMIFGVFVGTYSSIYIAAPMLLLTGVKRDWSGAAPKKSGRPAGQPT